VAKAAAAAGVDAKDFSAGIASQAVAGFVAKLGQTPLVAISVTGDVPAPKLRLIASSLATSALDAVSGYVNQQVAGYEEQAKQLLAQAKEVEQGHVVGAATSAKTTARSRRNAVAIGALIGLILAALVALAWSRRRPA